MTTTEVTTQSETVRKLMATNSLLVERLAMASRLGISFGGMRDIYKAAGYKKILDFNDYYGVYRRQGRCPACGAGASG